MARNPNTTCSHCLTPIYRRPCVQHSSKSGRVFCSVACNVAFKGISEHVCPICSTSFRKRPGKFCSRACANKSRLGTYYTGSRKKDKCTTIRGLKKRLIELRGATCERCSYSTYATILIVHHVLPRAKGGTNELTNLELICPNCHAVEHFVKHGRVASGRQAVLKTVTP